VDNTSQFPPAQSVPPLYAWPKPGAIPEVNVAWADWIRLWSAEIDRCSGGLPGLWLANAVGALALQAEALHADGPESHQSLATQEQERSDAWVAALEAEAASAGCWVLSDPEPDPEATGSLSGHPADEAGPMQAWLGDPSCDDTYMN
jgi:hypothetical protein